MTTDDPHDGDDLIDLDAAVDHVRTLRTELLPALETERVSLDELAGRTLAEPIHAPVDVPAHSHATMDGFAFDATDEYPLAVVDDPVYPEDEPPGLESGTAIRIATGAPLPPSTNAVLKREEATVDNGRLTGRAIEPGTYVYQRGSNVSEGEKLFDAGERLGAKDALLLGDLGIDGVAVRERTSVGLLATGTEIHEGRHRDLDSPMLAGLVRSWGHEATYEGSVPDENDRVESRIDELAREHDVVVTTGGTSVGDKDYVIRTLDALGDVLFHRVRLRPGKPIGVARLPDHDAVAIAVPGKPVGAYLVTALVARPFFTGDASLPTVSARMAHDVGIATAGFTYAIPVTLEDGTATGLGHVDSPLPIYEETFDPSVLSSSTRASRADGFVLTTNGVAAEEPVDVVPATALER
ncbi:molybdopterin molybdotransferase MoeA [Natrinema longum]|uniref:Molybdopterin molybdotransferase MoeA n=1 Tax=Natrinema longum TaxID=370324 RepID=A0A8A2U8N9_9EURY|nr:molybdopterin molybdotransferase MoeA [Natrinema longum]MBZ6493625.1 molybdopterin molybdotransferase MoeA [Natrinema longum]QSW85034.1 molybdopterin molybdotransferase MoeA [Natrinema longum]